MVLERTTNAAGHNGIDANMFSYDHIKPLLNYQCSIVIYIVENQKEGRKLWIPTMTCGSVDYYALYGCE
jgi:hypothetical protein